MRWYTILALIFAAACVGRSDTLDGDQPAMQIALDAESLPASESTEPEVPATPDRAGPDETTRALPPPNTYTEQITETLECPSGGSVLVNVRRTRGDDPYFRQGTITWNYDACVTWEYGQIDGTVTYSREQRNGPQWERKLNYYARLTYTGTAAGQCDFYVQLGQKWHTAEHPLELGSTCPHPVRQWWSMLGF